MTNAVSPAWRQLLLKTFYFVRSMFTARQAGCSGEGQPTMQSSSCALQAFEMVAPAQTKFVLFRRVFLCFLPLQELRLNACLVSGSLKRWRK